MSFNKDIVLDCIKEFFVEFSMNYTKAFAVALIQDIMDAKKEAPAEPIRELLSFERQPADLSGDVKVSEGGNKFKTQFWRINADWNIEVWKKEEDAVAADEQVAAGVDNAKKPVKVICPWDYYCWYWTPPNDEFPKRRGGPEWVSDADREECKGCEEKFTTFKRKHHCRTCGDVYCQNCTGEKWPLYKMGYPSPQKVCDECFKVLSESGIDALNIPEAEEDEQVFGLRLTHGVRKPYFFLLETRDEQRAWKDALYWCCRKAAVPRNPNHVLAAAFEAAHRAQWNSQGPWWRWWKVFGSEEEMMTMLLSFIVRRRCLGRVMSGLSVPGAFRRKAEAVVKDAVDNMVSQAIEKSWQATVDVVQLTEEPVREALGPLLEPIGAAKQQIIDSLRSSIAEPITVAIDTCARPLLDKVLPMAFGGLLNSHILSYGILSELVDKVKTGCSDYETKTPEQYKSRVRRAMRIIYYRLRTKVVQPELQPMTSALRLLGNIPPFNYLYPYGIQREIYESLEALLYDALFTLECDETVNAALESGDVQQALTEVYPALSLKYYNDSKICVEKTMVGVLNILIGLPIRMTVFAAPGVSELLATAESTIPDPLKDFLSIQDMFDELLNGVISDVVKSTVEKNNSAFEKLDAGFKGMNE